MFVMMPDAGHSPTFSSLSKSSALRNTVVLDMSGPSPFVGYSVRNHNGEYLGYVAEVMLDMVTGKNTYAIVSQDPASCSSIKMVAIPWGAIERIDDDSKNFILPFEKSRIDQALGFTYETWPDMSDPTWISETYARYRNL